jgi:hypothetical protein
MIGPSRRVDAGVRLGSAIRYSFGPDIQLAFFYLEPHNRYSGGPRASWRHKAGRQIRVSQRGVKIVHTILYLKFRL